MSQNPDPESAALGGAKPLEPDAIQLAMSTFPDRDQALAFVRTLVSEKLIACGQVLPGMTSVYEWEGKVCESNEWMVFLKTDRWSLPALRERALALHPYGVPEWLTFSASSLGPAYGAWVVQQCSGTSVPGGPEE